MVKMVISKVFLLPTISFRPKNLPAKIFASKKCPFIQKVGYCCPRPGFLNHGSSKNLGFCGLHPIKFELFPK
jgi:hypothetical protein